MTNKNNKIAGSLLLFFFFNICSFTNLNVNAGTVEELEALAVSLIIDKSGSMSTTDPLKMRETAANIFIDLLSPEDNLGIISFSTETLEIQPMSNIASIGKNAIKENIAGKFEAEGDTDYQKAFQKAYEQLNGFKDENVKKVIVFLTDGNPDPDPKRIDEPGFMDAYMSGFWDTVKLISGDGYPIYSVGFGALDQGVMDRIGTETQGQSKVFTAPEQSAVEFFNIISRLKNRNIFLNENYTLAEEQIIEFDMDEYVSQMTFVITNTTGEFAFEVIPPEGVSPGEKVKIISSLNYSLLTLNQTDKELSGKWKIKAVGASQVSILGAKDLFVKIWIASPITNSQHSINDPIEIIATTTGDFSGNIQAEGQMLINGIQSLKPINMTKNGNELIGTFEDTKEAGEYEIILNMKQGETIIASTNALLHVKVLPTITSDIAIAKEGFRLGEKKIVTSTLELGSTSLKESKDLVLEYYNLVASHEEIGDVVFPLNDKGVIENGDLKPADGRFSTNLIFEHEGTISLSLQVKGTYKGEIFILEKKIGDAVVYAPGSVVVNTEMDTIEAIKGQNVGLDLKIESFSDFEEIIEINVPADIGTLDVYKIPIGSKDAKTVRVYFTPINGESSNSNMIIPLSIKAENGSTTVNSGELKFKVQFITKIMKFLAAFNIKAPSLIILFSIILIILILLIVIGILLYNLNYKPLSFVSGWLMYIKVDNESDDFSKEQTVNYDLQKFKKAIVTITFDPEKSGKSDIYIEGSKYIYDIVFEKSLQKSRFKFVDGYKSIIRKNENKVIVRATEPGIIIVQDNIFTNLELRNDIIFSSGDYIFKYIKKKSVTTVENEAKNILEGKI